MTTLQDGPEAPEPTVRRTRLSFRITMEGVMLLIVILLVGFAAWHSGTNLLYLIFSILISFYLAHGFLLSLNLSSLDVSNTVPETVIVDQPFDVTIIITNSKKRVPSYAIKLSNKLQGASAIFGSVYFPVIPPRSDGDAVYTAMLTSRGLHTLSTTSITTRYPFGFEERGQTRYIRKKILALPPTYGVSAIAANIPSGFGDQESPIRGSGTELYGLREYAPGEHARHIHWKTSARVQKLMVAEYTRDERRQVVLFLDNGIPIEQRAALCDDFENAIILTASLARHLIDAGFEVGLLTTDNFLPVGQGPSHLISILRNLALIELKDPQSLAVVDSTIVRIAFHDHGNHEKNKFTSIDSRAWTPPRERYPYGESFL